MSARGSYWFLATLAAAGTVLVWALWPFQGSVGPVALSSSAAAQLPTQAAITSSEPTLVVAGCGTHDLGSGKAGELLQSTWEFGNAGGKDLNFHMESGCACTDLEPRTGRVPPGGKVAIKLAVRLREEGRDENFILRLVSNDPVRPVVEQRIIAHCPPWLQSTPSGIDFGRRRAGTPAEALVRLKTREGVSAIHKADFQLAVSPEPLSVEWVEERQGQLALRVRLASVPKGDFVGRVVVRGRDEKGEPREQRLAVTARGIGPFTVAPSSLSLARSAGRETDTGASVTVRLEEGADNEKLYVECPPSVSAERMASPTGSKLVTFRLRPAVSASEAVQSVFVYLRDKPEEKEVVRVHWRD